MPATVVMLVDLDYFYAQCEERRNPSIKEKPVVVCVYSGRSETSGAVATANYIARQYGVKSGIPISLAKKRLDGKDAVFLPMDRGFYEEVSERIMSILRGYADCFEQVGIDEAYLDVSERVGGNFEEAEKLAHKIKENVKSQEEITCSVGVGPNKLVAKIAADAVKPNGLMVVEPSQVESFMFPLSVDKIIGIGSKTTEAMHDLGIHTINELASYDVQKLVAAFGKNLGTYFHNASLGIDDELVQERGEVESISRIATLKENTLDLKVILEKVNQLSEEVHSKVLDRDLTFKSVGIVAIMIDLSVHSRSRTFETYTNQLGAIKKTAKELFEKLVADSKLDMRRVGVKVSSLKKDEKVQEHITDFLGSALK